MLFWKVRYAIVLACLAVEIALGIGFLLILTLGIKGEPWQYITIGVSLIPATIALKLVDVRWPGAWERFVGGKPKTS